MRTMKSVKQKMNINKTVSIVAVVSSVFIVIIGFFFSYKLIEDSKKAIYIIDNGVPILAERTDLLLNRPVEYEAQINLFHSYFFTLTPDDDFIRENIDRALYLIDDSGMKEHLNIKEKGFYNQIISSNSVITIHADSINIDLETMHFIYYGKQTINRKSSLIIRNITTEGYFENTARSNNNPHGVLLKDWKIIDNTDLFTRRKY